MMVQSTITAQVRRGVELLGKRYRAESFLAYFQAATNTHAPVERLRRLYDEALAHPQIVGLAIGTVVGGSMGLRIPMTAVPQRTALSHSLGALAATLIGIAEYVRHVGLGEVGHDVSPGFRIAVILRHGEAGRTPAHPCQAGEQVDLVLQGAAG